MPAHECAFALSITFAELLPVESKWESLDLRSASNFFGLAGGAVVRAGWDRKRVKTLDALLLEGTVVSMLGSLLSEGRGGSRAGPVQPKRAMRTRADLLWWARDDTPRFTKIAETTRVCERGLDTSPANRSP